MVGMHRIINDFDKNTASIAAEQGLTLSQFAVLEALYSKGNMSVGMVRDSILSTMGTISIIVDNLVKQEYIERLPDEKDRRVSILHLTQKGYDCISQIAPKNESMIIEYMSVLDNNEQEELFRLIKKLGGKTNEKND